MEKKRNQKLHDKYHHAPDAYELYEAEHTARWLKDSSPRPSAHVNKNQFEEVIPMDENRIVVHDKHQKHQRPSDAYGLYDAEHMARWLKDAHPCPSSRLNSNQFEEINPEAETEITVDYWRTNDDSTDGKRVNYEEPVDAEAEEFIEMGREKHGQRKWMAMKWY